MGNFIAKLKNFIKAVCQKLVVKAIVALIVLISCSVIGYSNKRVILAWLSAEHTLTDSGFMLVYWFSLPCQILLWLLIIVRFLRRNQDRPYSGKHVVITILSQWIKDNKGDLTEGQVICFRTIDAKNGLKKGSTKKYLKRVIDAHPTLCCGKRTKDTMLIKGDE